MARKPDRPVLLTRCAVIVLLLTPWLSVPASRWPPAPISRQQQPPGEARLTPVPAPQGQAVDGLSLPVQSALSADLGRDDPAYRLAAQGEDRFSVANPRAGLTATLSPAGLHLQAGAESWTPSRPPHPPPPPTAWSCLAGH